MYSINTKAAILVLILLVPNIAQAEGWFVLNCCTKHFSPMITESGKLMQKFNEGNRGMGIEVKHSEGYLFAGTYTDSFHKENLYLGKRFVLDSAADGALQYGITTGVMTHSRILHGQSPVVPILLPGVSIQGKHIGVNITVFPLYINSYTPPVVMLQIKIR